MKKLTTSLAFLFTLVIAWSQTARVQIIHNSPDPGATQVDIYVNNDLLLDNFAFRAATPFVDVPAGVALTVRVAPPNSTSAAQSIANFPLTLESGRRYIVVANGLLSGAPGFGLSIFDQGREEADDSDEFDLAVLHGSPNAPAVDIAARGIGNLLTNVSYNQFADYLSLDPDTYYLDVKAAGSPGIVATFKADVSSLEGLSGIAIASGLLGGSPAFGIIVVLADGTVVNLPTAQVARLQVIHNSPKPKVDLYVNGDMFVDNFVYRTATPFVTVPAGVNLNVAVAPKNSNSAADAIADFNLTLENGKTYVVVASGVVGGNPGFDLKVFDQGQERADSPGNVGILFFHGSPDAPQVDILANGGVAFDNVSYGGFSGYINVPADEYQIDVTPANDNSAIVASYDMDLSFWKGRTVVVFASGFLGGGNSAFRPWVALDKGGTFPLDVNNNLNNGSNNLIFSGGNTTDFSTAALLSPNPASNFLNINLETEQEASVVLKVFNVNGEAVMVRDLGVQPAGSQTVEMDVDGLQNGAYFMQIQKGNDVQTARFQVIK